ncbi:MAG: YkgJ family cysteine cluster protein [Proteobacteria bacterium]|nr:YkgJ family cysteine cluster protein [Pseudomonadota bacterium]
MDRTYFTWPDRRLRYVCAGCGACCKGHGIGFDVAGGELVQLVARRPAIAAYLRRRGDTITAFNPRDRCWFLSTDGQCDIETTDGRAAKPASCRLFPFNRVFRIGSYTVVDYNSAICPLEIGAVDEAGISHAAIAAEIAAIADPAVVGTALPAHDAEAEGAALVATERAACAILHEAAARGDLRLGWSAMADATAFDDERAVADAAMRAIAHHPWHPPSTPTLVNALWLTPSLRFGELYGPRQYARRADMAPVLARMWLAWLGFAHAAESLSGRAFGLPELTTMWTELAPILHVIARWQDAPAFKPGQVELASDDPLVRALAQKFVDNRTRGPDGRATLAAIVEATLPDDPVVRVTTLKLAESVIRAGFAR